MAKTKRHQVEVNFYLDQQQTRYNNVLSFILLLVIFKNVLEMMPILVDMEWNNTMQ